VLCDQEREACVQNAITIGEAEHGNATSVLLLLGPRTSFDVMTNSPGTDRMIDLFSIGPETYDPSFLVTLIASNLIYGHNASHIYRAEKPV
jgi:hypothetical protein